MKIGRTANIRVNPKDCLSCIDVVQKTGMNLQGASFAVIVSAALSCALESFRQSKLIPDRDGFEYDSMMRDYPLQPKEKRSRALSIGKILAQPKSQVAPAMADPALARKKVQFDELAMRWNADPDNMSQEEQDTMHALALELNPI